MTGVLAAARSRRGAYARLAKLDVFDYYLAVPLAWALAGPDRWFAPATLAALALFLLGAVLVVAAAVAFDDVTGYRDGSDAANYGPDAPARRLARKPLLSGELTEAQAVRFAWLAAAAGAAAWGCAVAVAPFSPVWTVVLLVVCLVTAVQYSWGLKISYRGGQEAFLAGFGTGLVLCACGLVMPGVGAFAVVQAVLFGLGPLLFGVYSNTRDAGGDARVGRLTVAAVFSPRANAAFIVALSVGELAVVLGAPLAGVAPWWFPLALLPVLVLRAGQLRHGLGRGDTLTARLLGIRAHRAAVTALVLVDVLVPLLGKVMS